MRKYKTYDTKVVVTGDLTHIYKYDNPIKYDYKKEKKIPREATPAGIYELICEPAKEKITKPKVSLFSRFRAKKAIQRILQTNISSKHFTTEKLRKPLFITYTFSNNVQEVKEAAYEFTKYIKRLNYEIYGTKFNQCTYLAVPERQKRGAIHFHTVHWGLPYIEKIYDTIASTWGNGFVWIEKINDLHHLTAYVSKYITKQKPEKGQKAYYTSRNINRPKVYKDKNEVQTVLDLVDKNSLVTFQKVYQTEYNIIEYEQKDLVDNYACIKN